MSLFVFNENVKSFTSIMNQELHRLSVLTRIPSITNIPILIMEDTKKLGFFNPTYKYIALHRKLIYIANIEVSKKILSHEVTYHITVPSFEVFVKNSI